MAIAQAQEKENVDMQLKQMQAYQASLSREVEQELAKQIGTLVKENLTLSIRLRDTTAMLQKANDALQAELAKNLHLKTRINEMTGQPEVAFKAKKEKAA